MTTVAHDQPVTILIDLTGMGVDIGGHLSLQRRGQHLPGPVADNLIEQRPTASTGVLVGAIHIVNYREQGPTFPNQRANAGLDQTYDISDHPREGAPTFTPPRRRSSTGTDHCSGDLHSQMMFSASGQNPYLSLKYDVQVADQTAAAEVVADKASATLTITNINASGTAATATLTGTLPVPPTGAYETVNWTGPIDLTADPFTSSPVPYVRAAFSSAVTQAAVFNPLLVLCAQTAASAGTGAGPFQPRDKKTVKTFGDAVLGCLVGGAVGGATGSIIGAVIGCAGGADGVLLPAAFEKYVDENYPEATVAQLPDDDTKELPYWPDRHTEQDDPPPDPIDGGKQAQHTRRTTLQITTTIRGTTPLPTTALPTTTLRG